MAIITISRGTKSGGQAVAECLARRLGYPCVAREVLQEAAEALGASEATVRGKLLTPPGPWDLITRERHAYVVAVRSALASRCLGGNLIYHGLAGQFLLRDLQGVLRVRLIAPMALRIRALAGHQPHPTHEAAERFIRKVDRDRRRWVRRMYGVDVAETSLYELTINLESISLETACLMIGTLAGHPPYATTEAMLARIDEFATTSRRHLDAVAGGHR